MAYPGSALLQRTAQTRYVRGGVDLRTMTGNETFDKQTANLLGLAPGGSDRTITLPAEGESDGMWLDLEHTGIANTITVQDDTPTALVVLNPGDRVLARCDGSSWAVAAMLQGGEVIADPGAAGAIPVTRSGSVAITTAGAEGRTLADPTFVGQRLSIFLDTDGGDLTITAASGINQLGNTSAVAADAGGHLSLEAITVGAALRWRVLANDGFTLS